MRTAYYYYVLGNSVRTASEVCFKTSEVKQVLVPKTDPRVKPNPYATGAACFCQFSKLAQ